MASARKTFGDTFLGRAASNSLGKIWVEVENVPQCFLIDGTGDGDGVENLRIHSQAASGTNWYGYTYWNVDWADDQSSEAKILNLNGAIASMSPTGPAVRINTCQAASAPKGYALQLDNQANVVNIKRFDGTLGGTIIATSSVGVFAVNDIFEIRAIGTYIQVIRYRTGVSSLVVCSAYDATYGFGKAGFLQGEDGSGHPDHWQEWSNWIGKWWGGTVSGGICGGESVSGLADVSQAWCRN